MGLRKPISGLVDGLGLGGLVSKRWQYGGSNAGFPVTNGLFHFWDPRLQGESYLEETERDGDQNVDFFNSPTWVDSDAPHIAFDGVDQYARSPSLGKFDGFSADPGNNTTFMWVLKFNALPVSRDYWFNHQLGRGHGTWGQSEPDNLGVSWSGRGGATFTSVPTSEWMTVFYGFDPVRTVAWRNAVEGFNSEDGGTASHWNSYMDLGAKNNGEHADVDIGFVCQWERLLTQGDVETAHNWLAENFSYSGISAV